MAKFYSSNVGGAMGQFGQALGNLGQTVYDIEAEEEFRTGQLALASAVEDFKRSLKTDPDYGTPGQDDGYSAKFRAFMDGTKDQDGAVPAALGRTRNAKAQGLLSQYAEQLMASQMAEVEDYKLAKWQRGTAAKEYKRLADYAGQVPVGDYLSMVEERLGYLKNEVGTDEAELIDKEVEFSQYGIKADRKNRALAQFDNAEDPLSGLQSALAIVNEGDIVSGSGKVYTVGDSVKGSLATDMKAEYAMREAAFQKAGEQFLSDYETKLAADPEDIITDISGETAFIEGQRIPKTAKNDAIAKLNAHNGDALSSYVSSRISGAQTPAELTATLKFLQSSGDLWRGKPQEEQRFAYEQRIRGLLAEYQREGASQKDIATATYAMQIATAAESVLRNDMPSESDRRGARMVIQKLADEAAKAGINMAAEYRSANKDLGVMTPEAAVALDGIDAMYLKAVFPGEKSPSKAKLSIQQAQELMNITNTAARMGDEGTKGKEQLDAYLEGTFRDISIDAFKAMRENKLGESTLTTDNLLDAVGLLQSGKLKNQIVNAAGRWMINPTIDASVEKARQYMAKGAEGLGFTNITPKPQPDGSILLEAKRPGLSNPYTLKPTIDEETGKMVYLEYIQSKGLPKSDPKAWSPWNDPATKKPAFVTPKAEAPAEKDKAEISSIIQGVAGTSGNPRTLATKLYNIGNTKTLVSQLLNAVMDGRISYSSILASGLLPMDYLDALEDEYEKRFRK